VSLGQLENLVLSKGGRVTLIKSTLFNLPTYFLSLFPIPACVANRIEKLQRDFLWGGIRDEFKYYLVSWDKVCSPIFEGGLGIRNLRPFNRALLGKWLWRFGSERELWWTINTAAYRELIGAFGVEVWKNIIKDWDSFSRFTRFVVGDGSKISSRHDLWCGDTALKVDFPALFGIACVKDASVVDNLEFLGDSNQWNVGFTTEAHDWEVDDFVSFFQVLR
jgi:hypothetical protein